MKLSDLREEARQGIQAPPLTAGEILAGRSKEQRDLAWHRANNLYVEICKWCKAVQLKPNTPELRANVEAQVKTEINKWWVQTGFHLDGNWQSEVKIEGKGGDCILHLPLGLEGHFSSLGIGKDGDENAG